MSEILNEPLNRFSGTRCEVCRALLTFHKPTVSISGGEQVDVRHEEPWCARWRNPESRELCIPRAILDECQKEES